MFLPSAFAQNPPDPPDSPKPPKVKSARTVMISRGGSYLGVGAIDIDEERAKALKLKDATGVEIKSVDDGSPAAKAGLKEGDVMLEFNGQKVEGTEQFARLVRETPAGRQVPLSVWRGGATQNLTATIGTRSGYSIRSSDGDVAITMPPMPPMPAMPPAVSQRMEERMQEMAARGSVLGVVTESLTGQLAEFFGVKEGALVRSVTKGSAAEKAGIKAGDVIVKIDDAKVAGSQDVVKQLRVARAKKTFPITVMRKQQETTVSVTLEERHGRVMPMRRAATVHC